MHWAWHITETRDLQELCWTWIVIVWLCGCSSDGVAKKFCVWTHPPGTIRLKKFIILYFVTVLNAPWAGVWAQHLSGIKAVAFVMGAGEIPELCGGTPQPRTVLGAGCIVCSLGLLHVWARLYDKVCTASGHTNVGTIHLFMLSLHLPQCAPACRFLCYSRCKLSSVIRAPLVPLQKTETNVDFSGKPFLCLPQGVYSCFSKASAWCRTVTKPIQWHLGLTS